MTSQAVGAPWMTRNEARRMRNLPAVDGGDDLVTPLNVLIGGQANPQDADSTKASIFTEAMVKHIERINRVLPAKGYDRVRFEKELAQDLAPHGLDHLAAPAHTIIETTIKAGTPLEVTGFFDTWQETQ